MMRPYEASLKTGDSPQLPYPCTWDAPLEVDLAQPGADSKYYYQDRFRALRAGGPVRVFSREYSGLLVSGIMSSFVYEMLRDCLRYLLRERGFQDKFLLAAGRFVDSAASVAFFVGLLSDCVPFCGYYRKSYLLLGWAITCLVLLVLVVVTQISTTFLSPYAFIALAGCCSFGTMISYVATEIRLVELSQREAINSRGFLIAVYTIFRISGQTLGRILSRLVLTTSSWSSIRHGFVAIFCISLVAPVCVYKYLEEPPATRGRVSWREGFARFKLLVQQHVVRFIIGFVCVYSSFSNVRISDADKAIAQWVGVGSGAQFTARVGRDFVAVMAVCVWSAVLMNKMWPKVFAIGPFFNSLPPTLLNVLAATDIYRSKWFYFAMSSLAGVSDGIFRLAYLVPLVEICTVGVEGQTVGLILSLDKLLAIIVRTASSEVFLGAKWSLTSALIFTDSSDARNRVAAISVAGNSLRLIAVLGAVFLPTQKADAQHQRRHGPFSPTGAALVVALFALTFVGVVALDLELYL